MSVIHTWPSPTRVTITEHDGLVEILIEDESGSWTYEYRDADAPVERTEAPGPASFVDRDGDTWYRQSDGEYNTALSSFGLSLAEVREQFGPLR